MKYSSSNQYEGEWAEDKKCGLGVMQWKNLDETYTGEWFNDKQHGQGKNNI
jgi:hypothetical protein